MSRRDPTTRFSDRVANYVRYRPGYPDAIVDFLAACCGWTPGGRIADLGSGTGISAQLFLRHGNTVYAVEPNREMREAAEEIIGADRHFHSIAATAEATSLPDASVDLVVAAQAFHWFDIDAVRGEVLRILRPGGHAVLIWNARRTDTTPFLRAYEQMLLTFGTDYGEVRHENVGEKELGRFFGGGFETRTFVNEQTFDFDALRGRILSSSYAPAPEHPKHEPMMTELRRIFDAHAESGRVRFDYDTVVHCGQVE